MAEIDLEQYLAGKFPGTINPLIFRRNLSQKRIWIMKFRGKTRISEEGAFEN